MRPGRAGADGSSAARPEIAVLMPETPSIMHWHRPRPQRAAHDSQHVLGMTRVLTGICLALAGLSLSAHAMGSARELADDCRSVLQAKTGAGEQIRIPFTKKALVCWGYMQAMQDLSVLADEDGRRIMGACPPERTTLLRGDGGDPQDYDCCPCGASEHRRHSLYRKSHLQRVMVGKLCATGHDGRMLPPFFVRSAVRAHLIGGCAGFEHLGLRLWVRRGNFPFWLCGACTSSVLQPTRVAD